MQDEDKSKEQLIRELDELRLRVTQLEQLLAETVTTPAPQHPEESYQSIFEATSDGLVINELTTGKVVAANPAFCRMHGYTHDEILKLSPLQFIDPQFLTQFDEYLVAIKNGQSYRCEARNIHKDGSFIDIEVYGTPFLYRQQPHVLGVVRDISERKRSQQRLLEIQKLQSLGVLAGGIAHDFNNILTAVVGNLGLARQEMGRYSGAAMLEELLSEAETGTYRAKELTRQLLTFAKGGAPLKKPQRLDSLLKEAVQFALRGSGVAVQFQLSPDLWTVEIDEGQIGQVLHNLVLNASQAMLEGGKITVLAQNITSSQLNQTLPLPRLDYVEVRVQDEGVGIAADVLPRIFDPYFTTKISGNGLGLAMVFSIITQHGGFITAESQVGRGTTFIFYLPADAASLVSPISSSPHSAPQETPKSVQKPKRVLIVDDEAAIQKVMQKILGTMNYEVDVAPEGAVALQMYRQAVEAVAPYYAVITDLTIPGGMGGKEVVAKLLAFDPGAKVIVVSGYSDDPIMARYREYGFVAALSKPFRIEQMRQMLDEVLGSSAS